MVATDIFEKSFYGFAYRQKGQAIQWFADAQKEQALKRGHMLRLAGAIVSPLYSEKCSYNYAYKLSDARQDFLYTLSKRLDERYLLLVERIEQLPPAAAASG